MQKTKFRKFINSVVSIVNPIISDSCSKRSVFLLSLLLGFYFTNSILSFLLDKSINTILLAILILLIMEISIRATLLSNFTKLSIIIISINNFRIGSTYALILEAYKLGSWFSLLRLFFGSLIHWIYKSLSSSCKYWFSYW